MKPRITPKQREELLAVAATTAALGKPTHLWAELERTDRTVGSLIRRGLINWRPSVRGTGWGKKFRAVTLTDAGRAALASQ